MIPDARSEERAYFRVRARIPFRSEVLEREAASRLALDVLAYVEAPTPAVDPELRIWLERIEAKIDRLIEHAYPSGEDRLGEADRCVLELSGAGLSYTTSSPPPAGSWLRLELLIPESPRDSVVAVGRVVHTLDQSSGEHQVGVVFDTIHSADRDAIVRYTMAIQREGLGGAAGEERSS